MKKKGMPFFSKTALTNDGPWSKNTKLTLHHNNETLNLTEKCAKAKARIDTKVPSVLCCFLLKYCKLFLRQLRKLY